MTKNETSFEKTILLLSVEQKILIAKEIKKIKDKQGS